MISELDANLDVNHITERNKNSGKSEFEKYIVKSSNKDLSKVLNEFADEELEHRNIAKEHNGEEAFGYRIMKEIIQSGCRGAIKIAEKI